MSLRRRITAATMVAVAAVALLVGAVGYVSARSNLIGETKTQLRQLAMSFIHNNAPHHQDGDNNGPNPGAGQGGPPDGDADDYDGDDGPTGFGGVPIPGLGQARGTFQIVAPSGHVTAPGGGTPVQELPLNAAVRAIARTGKGSTYFAAEVPAAAQLKGGEAEIYAVANPFNHTAVEVGIGLGSVDNVLDSLLLTYALLVGGGILLAVIVGTLVARGALRPINRFTDLTEQVTSALDRPKRLEETGAIELRRLAMSFNQTLDALERSIRAQQHLIADASHELRTPMAALRSNIQIFLEAERLPVEERIELQEAIIAELDELTQLTADVLDLARGAAPTDHIEQIELDTIVREAITRSQRRAPEISFETDLEETVIENAPDRVSRAVSNVIDNARKWSPPDGVVEISLKDGLLRVRDHGPGFKQSDLDHVFERFYRADEARRMPGSGLGLAIVRQAAEAFGGSATASNAEDGGAVIEVRFGTRPAAGLVQNS